MTLTEFLISLATNQAERDAYWNNPRTYINAADITPEHKELLISQSDAAVMDEVARENQTDLIADNGNIKVTTLTSADNVTIKRSIELERP